MGELDYYELADKVRPILKDEGKATANFISAGLGGAVSLIGPMLYNFGNVSFEVAVAWWAGMMGAGICCLGMGFYYRRRAKNGWEKGRQLVQEMRAR